MKVGPCGHVRAEHVSRSMVTVCVCAWRGASELIPSFLYIMARDQIHVGSCPVDGFVPQLNLTGDATALSRAETPDPQFGLRIVN